jgi:hypothetical protein
VEKFHLLFVVRGRNGGNYVHWQIFIVSVKLYPITTDKVLKEGKGYMLSAYQIWNVLRVYSEQLQEVFTLIHEATVFEESISELSMPQRSRVEQPSEYLSSIPHHQD